MYQFVISNQALMFGSVPAALITFMVLIGWLSNRVNHSPKTLDHAVLAPVVKSVKTENVVAVQNMITNVRWPINS